MKKIALLFTLALVGASQLYGMEPEKTITFGEEWKTIPNEVKVLIVVELSKAGNNLDEAIKNIIKVSRINKDLNAMINLTLDPNDHKKFIVLVHLLADKFNTTTQKVAEKFNTPVAKEYVRLGKKLLWIAQYPTHVPLIGIVIKEGADVDYTGFYEEANDESVLSFAIKKLNVKGVEYLLASGAKITNSDLTVAKDMASFPVAKLGRILPRAKGDEGEIIYRMLVEAKSRQDGAYLGLEK